MQRIVGRRNGGCLPLRCYRRRMQIPKGARAIVTGAGSGFGRAVSQELAKRGARVLASDLDLASAEATARDVGGRAMRADVRDARDVEALVRTAVDEWG